MPKSVTGECAAEAIANSRHHQKKRASMSAKVGKRRYEMYMLVHDQLFHGQHGCRQDACVVIGLFSRVVLRDAMSVREIQTERQTSYR